MTTEEQQKYNKAIERLSIGLLRITLSFIILPSILMLLTPYDYLTTLIISLITIRILNYIPKKWLNKINKQKNS